jgi:hypothetical protein
VITVTPVNDAPTAVANTYTTAEDTSVSGNVLTDDTGAGADFDIDGDSITAVAGTFATAQGGTVTLAANGTFTYTPAANFNGSDSFSYTITDGTLTSTATVTLTVTDVNDLPTATASTSVSGNEDTDIAVPSRSGGTDIDGTIATVTVTSACRQPPRASSICPTARRRLWPARRSRQRRQAASLIFTPAANFNGTVTIAVHRHRQRRRHQRAGQRGDHGHAGERRADGGREQLHHGRGHVRQRQRAHRRHRRGR